MDLAQLEARYNAANSKFNQDLGKARNIAEQGRAAQVELAEQQELQLVLKQVSALFQSMSEERQADLKGRIEKLVTLGLRTVFDRPYTFTINMAIKGEQMTASFSVLDGRGLETDVISGRGGGMASLIGALLQIVVLVLMRKSEDSVIFLDESFSHLSDVYVPRVSALLKQLSTQLGLQIVLVTHQPEFVEDADIAYKFSLGASDVTKVEVIKGG